MGKTLHYGSKGVRSALEDRINRLVLRRGTDAHFDAVCRWQGEKVAREVTRHVMGPEPVAPHKNFVFRDSAPGFGKRLPPR
jgi:hypothetical protein